MKRFAWLNLILAVALTISLLMLWRVHAQVVEATGEATELAGAPDGVHIAAISGGEADKTAQALDARIWRFRISVPAGVRLMGGLEIHEPGKPAQVIRPLLIYPTAGTSQQLLLGISPQGSSLSHSAQIKTFYEMSTPSSRVFASGPHDNPFNGCFGFAWASPLHQQDGTWLLLSGAKHGAVSWPPFDNDNMSLVLRLERMK